MESSTKTMDNSREARGDYESQQHQTGVRRRLKEYFVSGSMRPGERKLVQKIDFFILTFCCLSYFLNYVSLVHFISATQIHVGLLLDEAGQTHLWELSFGIELSPYTGDFDQPCPNARYNEWSQGKPIFLEHLENHRLTRTTARSFQSQQCLCLRHEGRSEVPWEPTQSDQHRFHNRLHHWTSSLQSGPVLHQTTHFLPKHGPTMGSIDNDYRFSATPKIYHGYTVLPRCCRKQHLRRNALYTRIVVHSFRARKKVRYFYVQWPSRDHDFWLHPDRNPFFSRWKTRTCWLALAVHHRRPDHCPRSHIRLSPVPGHAFDNDCALPYA